MNPLVHDFQKVGGSVCAKCGGVAGKDLPTSCPARPMSAVERKAVAENRIDYAHGFWRVVAKARKT